jgi:hypothetical protein
MGQAGVGSLSPKWVIIERCGVCGVVCGVRGGNWGGRWGVRKRVTTRVAPTEVASLPLV